MPDFVRLHLLSISREKITTTVFHDLANWLTFGCARLGQLLVWEWKSESYVLKQWGHYFDCSPDSQFLAIVADLGGEVHATSREFGQLVGNDLSLDFGRAEEPEWVEVKSTENILLDLMDSKPMEVSYHGDGEWSCATLRFDGDKGVHVFDPGAFDVRVRSRSHVAIFIVLDHGKWNVAYCELGIRLGRCVGEHSNSPQWRAQFQQAHLCEQLVLVIEERTENKFTYMIEVLEIDREGHFLVFQIANFHFEMSFLPGWWPSMGENVDRGVTGATTEDHLDDCANTKLLGLEAFWFTEIMQPSSQSDVL